MQTEIEAKFLNVNHNSMREKLKLSGATIMKPMTLMKRAMFDNMNDDFFKDGGRRLRVRDEGSKITATYKADGLGVYDHEVEVRVDSYENTIKLFESIGYKVISTQESKRETWDLNGAEVVLDEWPWLAPYIEIEGKSEQLIKDTAELLGFSWDDAVFGSVDEAYKRQYIGMTEEDSIGFVKEVTFDDSLPDYLKERVSSHE